MLRVRFPDNQHRSQPVRRYSFIYYRAERRRTCSTCEVRVDDLVGVRIQVDEHLQDELTGGLSISLWT